MWSYTLPALQTATDRLSLVIGGVVRAVLGRRGDEVLTDAMIRVIVERVGRVAVVISVLMAAFRAGTLRTRRSPLPGGTRRSPVVPPVWLPRGFGWLVRLTPCGAASYAGQLSAVLDDPEMMALLAASPRAVRTLKPLCRMLGAEMPVLPGPVLPGPVPPVVPVPPTAARTAPAGVGGAVPAGVGVVGRAPGGGSVGRAPELRAPFSGGSRTFLSFRFVNV